MAVTLTYECPDCKKIIQETSSVCKRHTKCPSPKGTPKLFVLTQIEVN